jgi:hypothetical protein
MMATRAFVWYAMRCHAMSCALIDTTTLLYNNTSVL